MSSFVQENEKKKKEKKRRKERERDSAEGERGGGCHGCRSKYRNRFRKPKVRLYTGPFAHPK